MHDVYNNGRVEGDYFFSLIPLMRTSSEKARQSPPQFRTEAPLRYAWTSLDKQRLANFFCSESEGMAVRLVLRSNYACQTSEIL